MHQFTESFDYGLFLDASSREEPPTQAVRPLVSLLGTEKVEHGHGLMKSTAGKTTWELTALTKTRLLRVVASAGVADWTLYSVEVPDSELDAVAYRLRDIDEVRVVDVTLIPDGRKFSNDEPKWIAQYAIRIGGVEVRLPSERSPYYTNRDRMHDLAAAVLEASLRD